MGRNLLNIDSFKNINKPHSRLLYKIAKKNNLTLSDLADELDYSYAFIVAVMKGTHNMSITKTQKIRKKYEGSLYG